MSDNDNIIIKKKQIAPIVLSNAFPPLMDLETSYKSQEQIVIDVRASPIYLNGIKTNKLIADIKSNSDYNFKQW
jgi:hypothetical protein